jgi:tetratricopeptide (TPR) repeat protein
MIRLSDLRSSTAALCLALLTACPVAAETDAGSYLAGRQAAQSNDFATATRYFTQSLLTDTANPSILESALAGYISLGQIDQAVPIAKRITELGIESQMAHLVNYVAATKAENWAAIFEGLEAGQTVSPLVDGLLQAWASVGEGKMSDALESFDAVIAENGMQTYGLYHKALALASVGDFEAADAIFSDTDRRLPYSGRSANAHAQILSQLDKNDVALTLMDQVFRGANNPEILALRTALQNGEKIPYSLVTTPTQGIGEIAYMVAGALQGDTPDAYTLQYARLANYLDPSNTQATLLTAQLLDSLGQYDLANATYATVPQEDPSFYEAELGRIDALRRADRADAAVEVAESLTRSHPDIPLAQGRLADILRSQGKMTEANAAYTATLDMIGADDPSRWSLLFSRAITFHSLDQWPAAEADFRAALALQPNQPQILNFLGYSLVERNEKLDEALQMIETAVAAEPENGAIVDSLGWVYFQLGRYQDAVEPMERAASLEAVDPIVNDHLGDVYWAVGRKIEASFQWHRALSFKPEEELASRIRRKLDIGLDEVLVEEGAAPLAVANDGG